MPKVDLTPSPASPRKSRMFVRVVLAEWGIGGQVAGDVEFLVSELVTNAVIHARTVVTVDVSFQKGAVQVAVSDCSTRPVRLRRPSVAAATGRGVYFLDRLVRDWEVLRSADGKTVRFTMSVEDRSKVPG